MKESEGDIWTFPADVMVITTNGSIRRDGSAVLGRGIALQALRKHSSLGRDLGVLLRAKGNHVWYILVYNLITFPVKHNWWEKADKELIDQSLQELVRLVNHVGWKSVALVRPGCGNGQLDWQQDGIRDLCDLYLDDRFTIVEWSKNA